MARLHEAEQPFPGFSVWYVAIHSAMERRGPLSWKARSKSRPPATGDAESRKRRLDKSPDVRWSIRRSFRRRLRLWSGLQDSRKAESFFNPSRRNVSFPLARTLPFSARACCNMSVTLRYHGAITCPESG